MITTEQIDLWLSSPSEHQRLEFKEAKTQFDHRKLYKYCVALANEGGGHLVLGVSDAIPRKVVGSAAFNNPIAMASKLFQAVGFRVDIDEVAHPDGRVVVFRVPGRPRGTAYDFEGAYLMRRFGICEEKSSGIDRVVEAAEMHQLPAPDFQVGFKRTVVILYGPRSFWRMDRAERIRACYQHCALQWVLRRQMTNQSLRERFKLPAGSGASISQVIQATLEEGLIKMDPSIPERSKKFARYLPIWA